MSNERMELNRAAFLAGSVAAIGAGLTERAVASASAGGVPASSQPSGERLLGRLMAGNKRFVDNDFPDQSRMAIKREMLEDSQAPFAAILGCADSRVIPNFIFVQGLGDLFVARVAGNFPDDLVTASLEYAVEHLGTRLVMVLGHQNCGAVKAVYSAIKDGTTLPPHLSTIQHLMAPGITQVVKSGGSLLDATEVNVRVAMKELKTDSPTLSSAAESGRITIVGGVYLLHTGAVKLLE
ncbi:MAG TPA: carbonic anhydrase [Candidatus Cybelea sp.]|jgi:carbonic anhydrase|nr:carbonic anhydrase [Candidatus Cybelea sp.]